MSYVKKIICGYCNNRYKTSKDDEICPECNYIEPKKSLDYNNLKINIYKSGIAGPMNKSAKLPSDYKEHMNKLNKAYKAKDKEIY